MRTTYPVRVVLLMALVIVTLAVRTTGPKLSATFVVAQPLSVRLRDRVAALGGEPAA